MQRENKELLRENEKLMSPESEVSSDYIWILLVNDNDNISFLICIKILPTLSKLVTF